MHGNTERDRALPRILPQRKTNLSEVGERELYSEEARRRQAKRKTHRGGPELGISRRYEALVTITFVILGASFASTHLAAQWLKYPTGGVPRKVDGKVDTSAPSPRMADGRPDFSGIWTTGEPNVRRTEELSSPKEAPSPMLTRR